jgi:putative transposase
MGRALRLDVGGLVYHVLNRASARVTLFDGPGDYQQFEQVLAEAQPSENVELI